MSIFNHIPGKLKQDFNYCRTIVHNHSENFPVGSLLAPSRIRPHLYAIYAFARTADDFADLPGRSDQVRLQLLDDWSRRLQKAASGEPNHPIFNALTYTFEATGLPPTPLFDLLTAFRMDVTIKTYDTTRELLDYCRYSANPVGRMMLHLADVEPYLPHSQSVERQLWSDAICTALQLANHWQDLGQDAWSGRPLYLPKEEMDRYEVTAEMIKSRRFSPMLGGLMLHLVAETRALFEEGEPLLTAVKWPLNLELGVIWESGMALLEQIEELGGNTLRSRPSLSNWDRLGCFRHALTRTWS
ncbi:MAG: squalene synthase HpnC [Magnetococcales bacterium]|nr:squalene synthase HpnC [Magnetococcales bacterium]